MSYNIETIGNFSTNYKGLIYIDASMRRMIDKLSRGEGRKGKGCISVSFSSFHQ